MNAITVFSQFPNETSRQLFHQKVKDEILSGLYNPIEFAYMLKCAEDTIEAIRKDKEVQSAIENEFDKHGLKTIELNGLSVTNVEKTKYDYSTCEDATLNELLESKVKIDELIKSRQKVLQNIKENDFADVNSGEIIKLPLKTYTKYFTFKQK